MVRKKTVSKQNELQELKNQLARALADYDNLRKRVEREREEIEGLVKITIVSRLLPIYDMIEGAQKHLKDSGLAITIDEFITVLKEEGIERIEVKPGDKFDEELHEAIEVVDSSVDEKANVGRISEVILSGWRLNNGPIIRHAKVKVGKKGR